VRLVEDVTAIVPAHNAAHFLPACLSALQASDYPLLEIIVFDDCSSDDTANIAANFHVKVIVSEYDKPLGPGRARNRASTEARTPLLLFVDADVEVHTDAVGYLVAALQDVPGVAAAFGSYDNDPAHSGYVSRYANLRHHYVHQTAEIEASTFWSGFGMIRAQVFRSIGGFDAQFSRPSIEDIELGSRVVASGATIRLVRHALAKHHKRWTLRGLWTTDIFRRAIPWSRLIAERRSSGRVLNASSRERLAAFLAHLVLLSAVIGLVAPCFFGLAVLAFLLYVYTQASFLSLVYRRGGAGTATVGLALQWCYHLYASAILGGVLVRERIARLATKRR
jgi:glycosyltransferase involved in cell wall biosynthesis